MSPPNQRVRVQYSNWVYFCHRTGHVTVCTSHPSPISRCHASSSVSFSYYMLAYHGNWKVMVESLFSLATWLLASWLLPQSALGTTLVGL